MDEKNAKRSVSFFEHQRSGCFWYRTKHPKDLLESKGVTTHLLRPNEDIDREVYDSIKSVQLYGIYPFSFARTLTTLKQDGKKIVYDIDDALDLLDITNPFYYSVMKDYGSAMEIIPFADHITAATPALAEYMKKKTNVPITVIPNCYVRDEWWFPRPKRERFRIGFAGAAPHIGELLPILPVIENLQSKYDDVKFLLMGFGQRTYGEWFDAHRFISTPDGKTLLDLFDKALSKVKHEWIPFVDFAYYPQVLTNMALDVGICPLADTPFNRHRSTSKAMEYTLSGALALAQNVAPFSQDPTSTLVDDWEKALTFFIENRDAIEIERLKHLRWIEENRNMDDQLETLKEVYGIQV